MKKLLILTPLLVIGSGYAEVSNQSKQHAIDLFSSSIRPVITGIQKSNPNLNVDGLFKKLDETIAQNKTKIAEAYLAFLSPQELEQATQFWMSPIGKKFNENASTLQQALTPIIQPIMAEIMQSMAGAQQEETVAPSDKIVSVNTKDEINKLSANQNIVVKFYADWCGPCKRLNEPFNKLAEDFSNTVFVSVNIDNAQELAKAYQVNGVPAVLVIKKGKVVDKIVGYNPERLEAMIKKVQ